MSSAFAGETMHHDSKKTYQPMAEPCFKDREWQLDLFGAYAFTEHDQEQIIGDHAWGGGLGVNYFFTRNLGVGVEGTLLDPRNGSDIIGSTNLNLFVRFPIDSICLAPYIFVGGGGVFNAEDLDRADLPGGDDDDDSDDDTFWSAHAGAGLEYRVTKRFGVFVDGRYTVVDEADNNFITVRSGIRIAF